MKVIFIKAAQAELNNSITYYNQQRQNLGNEFYEEIKRTIGRIQQFPEAWQVLSKKTRRCFTNRFPFGVIYHLKNKTIYIIAITHLRSKPNSWKSRITKIRQ